MFFKGDLRTEGIFEEIVNNCIQKFGRIDILVNNAGLSLCGLLADHPIEAYETVFDVNLKSAICLTKLCIPYLRESKGNVVNTSSILANVPLETFGYYCMSKAALDMFTKCIALEEGKNGIRANNVNPGKTAQQSLLKFSFLIFFFGFLSIIEVEKEDKEQLRDLKTQG